MAPPKVWMSHLKLFQISSKSLDFFTSKVKVLFYHKVSEGPSSSNVV